MLALEFRRILLLVAPALACGCQMTDQQFTDLSRIAVAAMSQSSGAPAPQAAPMPGPVGRSTSPDVAHPQQSSAERDPALVGTWQRSESFGGGDGFTAALRETLSIAGNGTFVLGPGEFAGGGASMSGGEPSATGQWATSGGVVYVSDGYSGWEPYARYHVQDSKLMFTFGDASQQVWYRA
jgi:hypothetical protein